jgi:acyl carrier protein
LSINGIPAWNSLGHMALVVALEKEFGIRFSGARVANLTSVAGIVKELQSAIGT